MMTRGAAPIDARSSRSASRRARAADARAGTDALRLVNGEGDGFPAWWSIATASSRLPVHHGRRRRVEGARVDALPTWLPLRGIYERSEGNVRTREGLARACGVLAGEEPPPSS
jgi:23S rRNA G2069 N7-methylase RlmK/C1962 C5-methylase RlmI